MRSLAIAVGITCLMAVSANALENDALAPGWITKQGKNIRLQRTNETLPLNVPVSETVNLPADIIRQLISAGLTVYLTRSHIEEEIRRVDSSNKEWPQAQLAASLRSALNSGIIPWAEIDRIQNKYSWMDSAWKVTPASRSHIKLSGPNDDKWPMIQFAERWESRDYSRQTSVLSGAAFHGQKEGFWNLGVSVSVISNRQIVLKKEYSPSEWQLTYTGSDSPAQQTRNKIMADIQVGLRSK